MIFPINFFKRSIVFKGSLVILASSLMLLAGCQREGNSSSSDFKTSISSEADTAEMSAAIIDFSARASTARFALLAEFFTSGAFSMPGTALALSPGDGGN